MEPRLLIRSGIAASAIAHLSILTLLLAFAEVHPFRTVIAEPITVDIVSPEEAAPKEIKPLPQLSEKPPEPPRTAKPEPSSPPATAAAPHSASQQAEQATAPSSGQVPQPNSQQVAAAQPAAAASSSPIPAAIPQQPDLAIKYRVRLGLPDSGGFDTAAYKPAAIPVDDTASFRLHLRKCSTLPPSIAPSDKLSIKLRVPLTPNATLAADPILIEASASPKGPALMQSAIAALQACQPYAMLPREKYNEWRVLDLSFTPQDFAGG